MATHSILRHPPDAEYRSGAFRGVRGPKICSLKTFAPETPMDEGLLYNYMIAVKFIPLFSQPIYLLVVSATMLILEVFAFIIGLIRHFLF